MAEEGCRIFIVEDEFLVAFEMSDILEDLGYHVVGPATHLEEACAAAETEAIDVALLDVNLGEGKTSEPVALKLRERDIPYAFVTAYDEKEITFRLSDDRVVRKPITEMVMIETLREIYPGLAPCDNR